MRSNRRLAVPALITTMLALLIHLSHGEHLRQTDLSILVEGMSVSPAQVDDELLSAVLF